MKIATLLFTYHRSYHTREVLSALRKNTVLPQKLFVFQDGLKSNEDDCEWKQVNKLIKEIDWCDTEIIVSDMNRGLAVSIVSGINYVFKEYDAIIVLEDDCVSAPSYMQFMLQGLTKYENNKQVYSVSGYGWPIQLETRQCDAYSCGRVSTWGWGTWKDRWAKYNKDFDILKRMKADQTQSRNLSLWGSDLEAMLLGTVAGRLDSWGVFWALNVIENKGICMNPTVSLIKHIGWDGTGTNAAYTDESSVELSEDKVDQFIFPDDTCILDNTKRAFADLYGCHTALPMEEAGKESILVYGMGYFFTAHEKELCENYNIKAFINTYQQGWFAGKKVIHAGDIEKYEYEKIIIMVLDIQESMDIAKRLISKGIRAERIILGISLFGECNGMIENIRLTKDGGLLLDMKEAGSLKVRTKDEFNNVREVFEDQIYQYFINNSKKDVIIDVGMNIGDASLYFLKNARVEKVYAYEPFKETYLTAQENLKDFLRGAERLEIFPYGISDENATRTLLFNRGMTCGQSTIEEMRKKNYEFYARQGLIQQKDNEEEQIETRDAAEVFLPILSRHQGCNIVLKMDCEGEEYGIVRRLFDTGILARFSFIMLEWHFKGSGDILYYLKQTGFSYWSIHKNKDMGMVYAYREK